MKAEGGEREPVAFDEAKYWAIVQEKPTEFSTWTSLIAFIEKTDAIAETANPSYGAEAVSESSSQAQALSSQENKQHSDTC